MKLGMLLQKLHDKKEIKEEGGWEKNDRRDGKLERTSRNYHLLNIENTFLGVSADAQGLPSFKLANWLAKEMINAQNTCFFAWAYRGNSVYES